MDRFSAILQPNHATKVNEKTGRVSPSSESGRRDHVAALAVRPEFHHIMRHFIQLNFWTLLKISSSDFTAPRGTLCVTGRGAASVLRSIFREP